MAETSFTTATLLQPVLASQISKPSFDRIGVVWHEVILWRFFPA
jgi:hypothetical protein